MTIVAEQRCFNHRRREAVARCPSCSRYYCRECITEHDDRVLCAACLDEAADTGSKVITHFSGLIRAVQFGCGLFTVWFIFYYLGRILLLIPSSFHEGTLWKTIW